MLASDIIKQARAIINEPNSTNSHFTDATLLGYINECTLQLLADVQTYPKVLTTVTSASTITLDKNILCIDYVAIKNTDGTYRQLTTIDFANFSKLNPNFLNTQADTPRTLVRMGVLDWMLYPTPSTEYLGVDMKIYAKTLPADITVTEEPPLSIALHTCYVYYLAFKCYSALNQQDKAVNSFKEFDELRKKNIGLATSTRGTLKAFSFKG